MGDSGAIHLVLVLVAFASVRFIVHPKNAKRRDEERRSWLGNEHCHGPFSLALDELSPWLKMELLRKDGITVDGAADPNCGSFVCDYSLH